MKPAKIQNEHGETIEVKCDSDGVIRIRHSDIDSKRWAVLHEYSKRMKQPEMAAFMEAKGITITPEHKELAERLGGYVVVRGKSYIVNAEEVAMIHEAVKEAGGIVPNWSSRP